MKDNKREMLTKFWTWTSDEFDGGMVNVWKEDDRENRWYSHPPSAPWKTLSVRGTGPLISYSHNNKVWQYKPQYTVTFCYSHLWRLMGWLLCLRVSWGFSPGWAWPGLPSGGLSAPEVSHPFPKASALARLCLTHNEDREMGAQVKNARPLQDQAQRWHTVTHTSFYWW